MTKSQTNSSDHKFINNILIIITRQITNEAFHTTIWVTNMKFRPMRPRHSYSKTPITTIKHLHRFHLCRYITNDPMVCYNVFFFLTNFCVCIFMFSKRYFWGFLVSFFKLRCKWRCVRGALQNLFKKTLFYLKNTNKKSLSSNGIYPTPILDIFTACLEFSMPDVMWCTKIKMVYVPDFHKTKSI